MAHAGNERPDQPARMCRLIRAFVARLHVNWISTNREGLGRTVLMHRLTWFFLVLHCDKDHFSNVEM